MKNSSTKQEWSRRAFLQKSGQLAGALCLCGSSLGLIPETAGATSGSSASRAMTGVTTHPGSLRGDELTGLLSELVSDLESKGLYASAFHERRGGLNAGASRGEKAINRDSETAGVCFTAYDGHRFREVTTDQIDADSLRRAAGSLKNELQRPPRGAIAPDPGPRLRRSVETPIQRDPSMIEPAEWGRRAEDTLERVHASDPRIVSARAFLSHNWRETEFVGRDRVVRQKIHRVGSGAFAFAMEKGKTARAFVRNLGAGGFENVRFDDTKIEELGRVVEDLLAAERITPGQYEVISHPAVTGLLAHESFGHGVEYDQFIKGRAKAAHFLNKPVAPEFVSIWDDPTQPSANGTYYYDDEGWEATPTQIVEGGIFRRPLTDLFSSHEGTAQRTANGRRQSFSNKAYARMSNTYFGSGETPVEEIFATLEDGVYLEGFQSGIEDPHGWGIQFTCNRGYEIKNGRRTGRIFSPVGVTGYVPDILGSITHVGNDFELVPGTCGKGHKEYVPVGTGGPHLRFTANLG